MVLITILEGMTVKNGLIQCRRLVHSTRYPFCHPHHPETRPPLHVNRRHTADKQWLSVMEYSTTAWSLHTRQPTTKITPTWPCHVILTLCDFRLGRDCGNKNGRKNQLFIVIAPVCPCCVGFAVIWGREREWGFTEARILFRELRMLTTCNGGIISDAVFMDRRRQLYCTIGSTRTPTRRIDGPYIDWQCFKCTLGISRGTRFVLVLLDWRRSMATACTWHSRILQSFVFSMVYWMVIRKGWSRKTMQWTVSMCFVFGFFGSVLCLNRMYFMVFPPA